MYWVAGMVISDEDALAFHLEGLGEFVIQLEHALVLRLVAVLRAISHRDVKPHTQTVSIVRKDNIGRLVKHSFVPNKDFGNIGSDDSFWITPTTTTLLSPARPLGCGENKYPITSCQDGLTHLITLSSVNSTRTFSR